jgi:hypothetical protein
MSVWGMMSSDAGLKAMHSGGDGKLHINKYAFIDMIVFDTRYPLLDSRIARRSLSHLPGSREGR